VVLQRWGRAVIEDLGLIGDILEQAQPVAEAEVELYAGLGLQLT
jgi:hypothetical protein